MWDYLNLMRIYTKPKGQLPDFQDPVILPQDRRAIEDFCLKIHKSLLKDFKYAYVWGSSVKFNPMKVGIDHVLDDEDIVQVIKKYVFGFILIRAFCQNTILEKLFIRNSLFHRF